MTASHLARHTCIALILSSLGSTIAAAQIVRSSRPGNTGGFSVRKEDAATAEALADFDRYAGKSEWEKAFAALSKAIDGKQPKGLIETQDGFFVPSRQRVREMLAALSPAGKQAYRLFNDAKARQLFDQAISASAPAPGPPPGPAPKSSAMNELTTLRDLFDQYLITSIGDQIGDRLGDALFESGDFSAAAATWGTILRDYPDTSIPPARLRAKRAIALFRAGNSDEFQQLLAEIRQKDAGQSMRIGGQDVDIVAMLSELASQSPANAPTHSNTGKSSSPVVLPKSDDPLWQCQFADDAFVRDMGNLMNNMNRWEYSGDVTAMTPRAVADDRRVYVSWFGISFAVDVETGKLMWRSGTFSDVSNRMRQSMQMGTMLEGDTVALAPAGDRLILTRSTGGAAQRRSPESTAREMTCVATDSGKQIWKASGDLGKWALIGEPLIVGDTIYIAGNRNNTQLHLLAIALADGKLLWDVSLGEGTAAADYRGMMKIATPILRESGGTIYVSAGNGALLAVNKTSRRVEWAFCFGRPVTGNSNQFFYYERTRESPKFPASIEIVGGTLFVKDKNDDDLYAIDPASQKLIWKRPIDANATIACADASGSSLCMLSEEVSSIDLKTRDLRWSTKTPIETGNAEPLIAGDHLYLFGSRGVYDVDLRTGDRTIFRGYDRDSTGASVHRAGNSLICVSSRSVTAYPLPLK